MIDLIVTGLIFLVTIIGGAILAAFGIYYMVAKSRSNKSKTNKSYKLEEQQEIK